ADRTRGARHFDDHRRHGERAHGGGREWRCRIGDPGRQPAEPPRPQGANRVVRACGDSQMTYQVNRSGIVAVIATTLMLSSPALAQKKGDAPAKSDNYDELVSRYLTEARKLAGGETGGGGTGECPHVDERVDGGSARSSDQ